MTTEAETETQLAWERRFGRFAAAAAIAAAVLLLVQTFLVQFVVLADRPDNDRGALLALDDHSDVLLVSSVLQLISSLAVLVVFWYLFQATRYRRPEVPAVLVFLVYAAPLLYGIGAVLGAIDRLDAADQFASGSPIHGAAGENRAEDLLKDTSVPTIAFSAAGTLGLAILYVLISLNAMRSGLLSRFTGILGVVVGALLVLPLLPGGSLVIEIFWLGALGALFLGNWPGGRGPAWETGEAIPWPTAAERRGLATPEEGPAAVDEVEAPVRRRSRKRKRKR